MLACLSLSSLVVDRLATQFVCEDEARTLTALTQSCAIEDIEALLAAEDRYYTINRSTRLAQRLDQNWERSEKTVEAGEVYLQQRTEMA